MTDITVARRVYEGLLGLTVGEQDPVDLWGTVFLVETTELTSSFERPRYRVEVTPERPDLPPDEQPPTWPPPFAWDPYSYCWVSIEGGRVTRDRLTMEFQPRGETNKPFTWKAILTS